MPVYTIYILKKMEIWSDVTILGRANDEQGTIGLLSLWTMVGWEEQYQQCKGKITNLPEIRFHCIFGSYWMLKRKQSRSQILKLIQQVVWHWRFLFPMIFIPFSENKPWYSVCFGENCRVADTKAKAQTAPDDGNDDENDDTAHDENHDNDNDDVEIMALTLVMTIYIFLKWWRWGTLRRNN